MVDLKFLTCGSSACPTNVHCSTKLTVTSEARVEGEVMVDHRAWVPAFGEMVACPGSGQSAMRLTT